MISGQAIIVILSQIDFARPNCRDSAFNGIPNPSTIGTIIKGTTLDVHNRKPGQGTMLSVAPSGAAECQRAWSRKTLMPRAQISGINPYADGYGYFWYSTTQQIGGKPVPWSFASGNGGNRIDLFRVAV